MFNIVRDFEKTIANFYGSPYAIATDCCTHAIEICLRYKKFDDVSIPAYTYLSIPMTCIKLGLNWTWDHSKWYNSYYIGNTNIIDAAVVWEKDSYIPNTFMCLSFQFQKHLSLGRGGMILCDNKDDYETLSKMRYDGRDVDISWYEQDIDTMGYHYYMTPETAQLGLDKFDEAVQKTPREWSWQDYKNLPDMKVFKDVSSK